jgi:lactoylglutathione lyase
MARIAHIAFKVDDINPVSAFFEDVFGFERTVTVKHPRSNFKKEGNGGGHVSHHLSDGMTDLTLVKYDDESVVEPGASKKSGPRIHHFGIEAEDLHAATRGIADAGGQILSEQGLPTVKFRAPGGTMSEVVASGWFSREGLVASAVRRNREYRETPQSAAENPGAAASVRPRISHIAIKVDDVAAAVKFYERAFGFRQVASYAERDHRSVHLTDGVFDLAIIRFDDESTEAAQAAGVEPCIHHIGIDVAKEDIAEYTRKIKQHGCEFISDPGAVTVKFRVPGGGAIAEIAPIGWHARNAVPRS